MASYKFIISDPKSGKSYQKEIEDISKINSVLGMIIGTEFDGGILDLPGYKLKITGGSTKTGAPIKKGVFGTVTKRVLLSKGIGFNSKISGLKRRKSVRGTTLAQDIAQVNTTVSKAGKQSLDELFGKTAPEAKSE